MYFYFFCEYAAVIKFQGVIFGTVDNSVKFCSFPPPYPLVEICPMFGAGESCAFYLTNEFLESPPENLSVTDLKGGYFLRFIKPIKTDKFQVHGQQKFRDGCITAFCDNGYKISLETKGGFYAETLDFAFTGVAFTRGEGVNADLVFAHFTLNDKKILNIYSVKTPSLLFSAPADDFALTPLGFTVTEYKKDMAKHIITTEYKEIDGEIAVQAEKVSCSDKFDREKVTERLIPYAFSEELLCSGDYAFYLAEDLKENAESLKGFIGNAIGVTPPPIFRDYREVGFIKKLGERKYAVDYYRFDMQENKINNIFKT